MYNKNAAFFFFFFSSRRRHTRFDCDWSSDVCSSDLGEADWGEGEANPRRRGAASRWAAGPSQGSGDQGPNARRDGDRKSTRLNSSHSQISYAVFCLKKKKKIKTNPTVYCVSDFPKSP